MPHVAQETGFRFRESGCEAKQHNSLVSGLDGLLLILGGLRRPSPERCSFVTFVDAKHVHPIEPARFKRR
jgi:hypothetical protein